MIVPGLSYHLERYTQTDQAKETSHDGTFFLRDELLNEANQTGNSHADPDREGIERTRISIVSFAWLIRCLVEIDNDGQTGHEEEEENDPEALNAFLATISLPEKSQQTQEQWQHIEHIVSLVVLDA